MRIPLKTLKDHKACSKCHKVKSKSNFYYHPDGADRLQSRCVSCCKEHAYNTGYWKGGYHSDM
jgi:hypothetical protein